MCSYGFDSPNSLICSYSQRGHWSLARITLDDQRLTPIEFPYWEMGHGDLQVEPGKVVLVAGSPVQPLSLMQVSLEDGETQVLRVEYEEDLPPEYTSLPETIEFPTDNDETAHAFFYPPTNRDHIAPEGEKPPLLVTCHGGPHSAASAELNLTTQYWTSRGVAVLDVNYGGSTGYGRHYRERLIGEWGVVDVDDCVNAALYVVETRRRRRPSGSPSAAAAPAGSPPWLRWRFGTCSRPAPATSASATWRRCSAASTSSMPTAWSGWWGHIPCTAAGTLNVRPINFPEYATCPVIFFQGLEDTIVPAIQSEEMFNTLKANGVPTAYLAFEGEHHGFRMADTIKRCLSAEFYFLFAHIRLRAGRRPGTHHHREP